MKIGLLINEGPYNHQAADTAWHARAKISAHRTDARLGMAQREVTLRLRRPTAEQVAAAKTVLAVKEEAARAKLPRLAESYARSTLALAEIAHRGRSQPEPRRAS